MKVKQSISKDDDLKMLAKFSVRINLIKLNYFSSEIKMINQNGDN